MPKMSVQKISLAKILLYGRSSEMNPWTVRGGSGMIYHIHFILEGAGYAVCVTIGERTFHQRNRI